MDPTQKPASSLFPKAKVAAFARLKTLTDTVTSRQHKPDPVFPPPSWEIDKLTIDSKSGWDRTEFENMSSTPSGDEAVAKLAETTIPTEVPAASQPEGPEPLTFAQRIRDLIDSLPLPATWTTSQQSAADAPNAEVLRAKDGTSGPPVAPGIDEELVQMLSSEEVMNGDKGEAGEETTNRPSVWSILSTMRWKGKEKDVGGTQSSPDSIAHAQGGLMMYAPLEPANDSNVELAQTWPSPSESPVCSNSPIPEQPGEDVEWSPSTTQMSVYAAWWGYRLYLPPSVMATLDSVSLKTTTQAAMVTSALRWLLNQVPNLLVPPQFRPALETMKRLGPIVGFIGVFVAWSWSRIKKHDKGNGVVLTATWLLPVALVPMEWDAGDIYGPVLLPEPADRISPADREGFGNKGGNEEQETTKKNKWFWQQ